FASMRVRNFPPSFRSTVERGLCQSGDALFHFMICAGVFQHSHNASIGALMVVSTVMGDGVVIRRRIAEKECPENFNCLPTDKAHLVYCLHVAHADHHYTDRSTYLESTRKRALRRHAESRGGY